MHNEAGSYSSQSIKDNFYRVIYTRRPTVDLYENIVSQEKFGVLHFVESLTNPRMREANGETHFLSDDEKYGGENSSLVYAPFTDFNVKNPNRFSDGSYGVFYCAKELECAIEETKYHTLKFLQNTQESSYKGQHRVLFGNLSGGFCDIRNEMLPKIYSSIDYSDSQIFGAEIKKQYKDGIVFDSVRYKGGTCYAVFKPCVIKSIREIKCFNYILENNRIIVEEI